MYQQTRPRPPHANKAPARWPTDVSFLRAMVYAPSVPPNVLQCIKGKGTSAFSSSKNHVTIRRIDSATHPEYGQMGLFATKKIPPRTHIIDYFGEVHTDDRATSDYDLSLYRTYDDGGDIVNVGEYCCNLDELELKIDAARMGNEARFINDYRGIRPRPNALFKERRTEGGDLRMCVWSGDSDAINRGDEILVSYGRAWWHARQR